MSVFDDPYLIMEAAHWRSTFADTCVESTKSPFFSNFGSKFEKKDIEIDTDAILNSICNQMAPEILVSWKQDSNIPQRSKTAQNLREGRSRGRNINPYRTPLVTPNQSRRNQNNNNNNNNNNPTSSKVRFLAPFS
ncbi:hypothetical protein TVAG_316840 [Trichomonas vaginalis G3]|uniref:Uncharacterized protein n=1 Tax=Trichomonas vaginalis (strain ATCC PRA-98 / G3) TaxID=412133 RepID=A2F062_TRIV3|nr:hypothetical protein TVAGG3_0985540 [Trichomonas vaginalis G3]EAY01697.1 hypothetical protein TVAG_316840 [Trichomonas vaginalis G3]KAI5489632.1 hypothetical protein TVAGG3_0985540 [Trichomonas vaginalis G3]|eukprot:XP_001330393.1 hypothetical protein [Trichomonas vaginalis G3]